MKKDLKKYIENEIFPKYDKYYSHGMMHINRVIENILFLADYYKLDKDIAFVIGAYHDLGLCVNRKEHELESGKILEKDAELKKYFNEEELNIMKEAVEDHRGSRKTRPRNIYGEILSDSDRDFDIKVHVKRQLATSIKNYPEKNFEEHFEHCYNYLLQRINGENHFNLWTNNPVLEKRREKFEKEFLDKENARKFYQEEYERIANDGTIEKILNYYLDF